MPNKLYVNKAAIARRHVISQQLYRLRSRYRLLERAGLAASALVVLGRIKVKVKEYDALGGRPQHKGNIL